MTTRVTNFNAGPSTLPLVVLERVRDELLDYRGCGMSIMEMSHRSPEYDEVNDSAVALVREVLGLGEDHHVLFLGGGASLQFAMLPMNFLPPDRAAIYVDTGIWSTKAIQEARRAGGNVEVAASSADRRYTRIPDLSTLRIPGDAAYVHLTSNNTIYGTQYHAFPDTGDVPLVCDMSSDIASRRLDHRRFAMIYAGAQKNLGPAGVTLVIIRDDFLGRARADLPSMLSYRPLIDKKSMYNTPPVFGVYVMRLVLEWIRNQGGLAAVEETNRRKKDLVYAMLDEHPDFYRGTVEAGSRSWMNVTLRLPSEDLEKTFVEQAKRAGLWGLKGHRSVGGVRVSLYNAMTVPGVERLIDFMREFRKGR